MRTLGIFGVEKRDPFCLEVLEVPKLCLAFISDIKTSVPNARGLLEAKFSQMCSFLFGGTRVPNAESSLYFPIYLYLIPLTPSKGQT